MANRREQNEKETGRLEAFSDGVFAIAITLLILDIQPPHLAPGASNAALRHALLQLWPSYLAFLGSFFVILIMWVNHHGFFKLIDRVDRALLVSNGFLLLCVTFVPFPTAVLADALKRQSINTAAAFYCGTFVLISIAYNLLWLSAALPRCLFRASAPEGLIRKIRNAYLFGLPVYLAAALLAFRFAYLGLAICFSLWMLWATLGYQGKEER